MPKPEPGRPQTTSETIEVKQFDRMPYLTMLTYPKPDLRLAKSRMKQLAELGIDRVTFEGRTKIGRLGLVGIGTVGLVVKGTGKGPEVFALKIRRADANRESMAEEFRLTRLANRVRVGAPVYACTRGHHVDALRQGNRAGGLREGRDRKGERAGGSGAWPTPSSTSAGSST